MKRALFLLFSLGSWLLPTIIPEENLLNEIEMDENSNNNNNNK